MGYTKAARAVYDLAESCGVGIGEACDRAGISRSTPPRWKNGTRPRPPQLAKLRNAILALARERGALPAQRSEAAPETEPIALPSTGPVSPEHAYIIACLQSLGDRLTRIEAALVQLGIPLLAFVPLMFDA